MIRIYIIIKKYRLLISSPALFYIHTGSRKFEIIKTYLFFERGLNLSDQKDSKNTIMKYYI